MYLDVPIREVDNRYLTLPFPVSPRLMYLINAADFLLFDQVSLFPPFVTAYPRPEGSVGSQALQCWYDACTKKWHVGARKADRW